MKRTTMATRTLVAPGVLALALLVGCGDAVATQGDRSPSPPNVPFQRLAEAERLERVAKLDGLAKTYGTQDDRTDDPTSDFVPGSRHMPMR